MITGVYTGAVRWGYVDGQYQTMTDTGVLPNNPNADFVIGGCGRDSGTPGGASKIRMSEVLIFKDALSGDKVDKLEGYLAHKWSLTNRLVVVIHMRVVLLLLQIQYPLWISLFIGVQLMVGKTQLIGSRKLIWAVITIRGILMASMLMDTRQHGGMRVI